jgi:GDP-L-fucose synthase
MKLMNPISISDGYAKSKIEGLKLSSRLNSGASQFHSLILSNIYGPYDHFFDDRSLFIPLLMKKIRKAIIDNEVVIKFNSDLSNSLDLFHVADVTKVVRLFLDRELNYPILNVGNGRGEKLIEVAKQMMEIAGYRGTLVPGTEVVSKNKRPIMNVDLLNKASLDISQTLREGLT